MKKCTYLALAVMSMALIACGTKPAEGQASDQQEQAVTEMAEETAFEEAEPAEEPELAADSMAEEMPDSLAAEGVEEPLGDAADEETAAEPEAVAGESEKVAINGSDGNMIRFTAEAVKADKDGCVLIDLKMDKPEESIVKVSVQINDEDGARIGVYPIRIGPGGTHAAVTCCASQGGVFSAIQPGKTYRLSFVRVNL
ncbi:MAG: hypothetical protein IJ249_01160 [Paludibacteraceae bacterium]|nr:hypothetical protein [Paludibacteraceae bacterium]